MYHPTDRMTSRWTPTDAETMIAEAVAYLVSAQSVLDHLTRYSRAPEVSEFDLESAGRALAVALVSLDTSLEFPDPGWLQASSGLPTRISLTARPILDSVHPV